MFYVMITDKSLDLGVEDHFSWLSPLSHLQLSWPGNWRMKPNTWMTLSSQMERMKSTSYAKLSLGEGQELKSVKNVNLLPPESSCLNHWSILTCCRDKDRTLAIRIMHVVLAGKMYYWFKKNFFAFIVINFIILYVKELLKF